MLCNDVFTTWWTMRIKFAYTRRKSLDVFLIESYSTDCFAFTLSRAYIGVR